MAGETGTTADRLARVRGLVEAPYGFDFHQAMRRLECAFRELPRWGEAAKPSEEPVRIGQEPTRTWSKPMSMRDVVRSALSEIEAFARMEIDDIEPAYLPGNLVSEVAHLVAELCENAASFSPPTTKVRVVGSMREDGYRLAIIDRGIGMTDEQIADANEKLQNPAGFDRAPSQYLGHFVVGRLAARLGIDVRLFEPAEQGLVARITLPTSVLVSGAPLEPDAAAGPAAPVPAARAEPSTGPIQRSASTSSTDQTTRSRAGSASGWSSPWARAGS
jgi:anti-sigma regulatory factor (Ser/Thr protein kinase)